MQKKFKTAASFLLALLTIAYILLIPSKIVKSSEIASITSNDLNLVLDLSKYKDMPKHFRKSSDLTNIKNDTTLNLNGLDTLNASGSSEFSEYNLPLLIKGINTPMPIAIVDLRQESHGFINGIPVSWTCCGKNKANLNLTRDQVIATENKLLNSIKLNEPLYFYNHPDMSIIPKTVLNEEQLSASKSLYYIRIPVTDGKIPTDDMVDYFVKMMKTTPNNTWMHFHCKHGIGRTTTFMIMYDMLKNYKKATADEIIKRQLALAGFTDKHVDSFYNNERYNLLTNFYKYCTQQGNNFNTPWSEWKKSQKTFNYMKNTKVPNLLYVVSLDSMSPCEKTMVSTLQGIVNGNSSSQIYTIKSSQPDYKVWLEDLKKNYKIPYKTISSPWELLDIFKNYVHGYILYSSKSPDDPSINNACSLASLKSAIAVDESIQNKVISHSITKLKGDCRNTDEKWAYNNLWNSGLNHSTVIELPPSKNSALRDYAIMTKSLIFYEKSKTDTSLRDKIFSSMKHNSICLGWGPDEFINVSTASKHGVSMIAADWSYNLTVLSSFPSIPLHQKMQTKLPIKKNCHYVTFIMSDGDNQQWNLGKEYSSPKWYGSPIRGKFNIGWSLSPSLYYLAPTVFNLYYKTAQDYFVVPPSGMGYIYPSKFDKASLQLYISNLNNYMKNVDEDYVSIIDDSSFYNTNLWDKFTAEPNIKGLLYLDYKRHNNYKGKIIWSNNKPVVSCRDLLWNGIESEEDLVKNINNRINAGETDIHNSNSYTFVYVHAWSKNLEDVSKAINKLKENPKVEIVTPKVFMELIKKNVITSTHLSYN